VDEAGLVPNSNSGLLRRIVRSITTVHAKATSQTVSEAT